MSNERQNEQARVVVWDFNERFDAEPNVGPGFAGAFSYYLNPSRWGKTAGRATRKELAGVLLGNLLTIVLISFIAFGVMATAPRPVDDKTIFFFNFLAFRCWNIAFAVSLLTVLVRRLHDVGISGRGALGPFAATLIGGFLWRIDNGADVWATNVETIETLKFIANCGFGAMLFGVFWGARYWRAAFRRSGVPWSNRYGAPRLDPPRKRSKK